VAMNYSSNRKGAERVAQAIIDSAGEPSVFGKRVVRQSWSDAYIINIIRLRPTMSARAPAGNVKKKNGSEATVDIREKTKANRSPGSWSRSQQCPVPQRMCQKLSWRTTCFETPGFERAVQVKFWPLGRLGYLIYAD